jgi:hypothetical protein
LVDVKNGDGEWTGRGWERRHVGGVAYKEDKDKDWGAPQAK